GGVGAREARVSALGGAAEHGHHLDAGALQGAELGPEGGVARVVGRVIVEGQAGRVVVDVQCGDNDVGDGGGTIGYERKDRDGRVVGVVVGLIVGYHALAARDGRHGGEAPAGRSRRR